MKQKDYIHLLKERPCDNAIEWLKAQPDLRTAWNNCENGGWLWWALRNGKDTLPNKSVSMKFAKWCAKQAKEHAAYAAAADTAYAAAASADAAAYAAAAYADIAADADAADIAADAAADAAYAAAYAAASAERKLQADWIRANIKFPLGDH